jgi:hypothetical protein
VITSGARLAGGFHDAVVAPLLARQFPGVAFAAGRLGSGSDVLGYDDERSGDHDWGCRLTVLVDGDDAALVAAVDDRLEAELPAAWAGHPVRFPTTWDPRVRHKVEVATPAGFGTGRLGVDPTRPLTPADWLVVTGQAVLEVTAGPVFADPTGALGQVRDRLGWYPDDVWLHVLAAGWQRITQELPMVGRTGERGDDAGSRIVAARLVRDLRHLCFLVERRWAPYPKWAGTAFARLELAPVVGPALARALRAEAWEGRQQALADAAEAVLAAQAARGLPVARPATHPFHDRPALVANPGIATALRAAVTDPWLRRLPPGVGSIEQWVDSADVLAHPERRATVAATYRALADAAGRPG